MDNTARDELAVLLAQLRRDKQTRSGLDARLVPPDPTVAYEVAGLVAAELARPVVGWKIAAFKENLQRQLRTDAPIYGRVYDRVSAPASVVFTEQRNPIPEAEFQVLLAEDLPPRANPYTVDEVAGAVASVHPGMELAECSFDHDNNFPPLPAILADGAGAGTIVYGPAIDNWQQCDLVNQQVVLYRNGQPVREGTAREFLEHPLVPVTWLANVLSQTGVGLKSGEMISTGTLTGMLKPRAGDTFTADFGPFGAVSAHYA